LDAAAVATETAEFIFALELSDKFFSIFACAVLQYDGVDLECCN